MPDFVQYLRGDDLLTVSGDAVYADTRVNPDGTLDISRWTRPQHDGPPLRALAVLRWLRTLAQSDTVARIETVSADTLADAERLLRIDLALTAAHWREPSLDIWEEELGHHYFTLRVSAAALNEGAEWLRAGGEATEATALRTEAQAIRETLDRFWLPDAGYYRSRIMPAGVASTKMLDIAVILAAVHAGDGDEVHSVRDARMHATLEKLERLFDRLYPINRNRPRERAPAMGRYEGDVYFSGGAYYFSTLGAAEFCFLAAAAHAPGSDERSDVGRARRRVSRNRSRLHAGERRSFRTVRSTHRRANVREASRVELCRFHLVRDGAPSGGLAMTETPDTSNAADLAEAARAGVAHQARMIYRAIFASPVGRRVIVLADGVGGRDSRHELRADHPEPTGTSRSTTRSPAAT